MADAICSCVIPGLTRSRGRSRITVPAVTAPRLRQEVSVMPLDPGYLQPPHHPYALVMLQRSHCPFVHSAARQRRGLYTTGMRQDEVDWFFSTVTAISEVPRGQISEH